MKIQTLQEWITEAEELDSLYGEDNVQQQYNEPLVLLSDLEKCLNAMDMSLKDFEGGLR